tara:strand:- start:1468 stop:2310 length:843 start_codon:yes stop_codon:yes gene_type:complete
MIKKIFFSLLKSFTIAIIISLIGYNLYSPLTKDSIYQLEMNIEPNTQVVNFGTDVDNFSKLVFLYDAVNSYEILKLLENYVKVLHKYETIGNCDVKKIDGRIPYLLTQENKYYELINFKLLGNQQTLENCNQDIRNRIKKVFNEKKDVMISNYNEIQVYNSRYQTKQKSMDMIIAMGMFGKKQTTDSELLQDIYENLTSSYSDYYTVLNDYSKKVLKNYQHVNSLNSEITLYKDEKVLINFFFSPLIVILNLFAIILITIIDLVYFKKINLKKLNNFFFN